MRTTTLTLGFVVACALPTLAGCVLHGGGSGGGGSGGYTFAFDNCTSGCELDKNPVAAGGARTTIVVTGPAFADVRSSDPSVAAFSRDGGGKIDVISGAPGVATLQLVDGSGRVVASADVTVVATTTLKVNQGWTGSAPLVLEGTPQIFHVTTLDANGNVTRGDGSVSFTLDGTLAAAVVPLDGDAIGFVGTPGTGTIHASCPNASVAQPITVVPLSAITGLRASVALATSATAAVSVVPESTEGDVYTERCAWQTSDPSVTLGAEVGPSLDLGPGEVAVFNLNRPGSYTATCTVAGQTATVTLQR